VKKSPKIAEKDKKKIAKNVKSCLKVPKIRPNGLFKRFLKGLKIHNYISFRPTLYLSQVKQVGAPTVPSAII
jgi:hypothetical protein